MLSVLWMGVVLGLSGCKDKAGDEPDPDTLDSAEPTGPCESMGLSTVAFSDGPYDSNYGDLVADFSVNTLDGSWSFQENWTGCDNHLFINYHADYDYAQQLWASDIGDWLDSSPENTHYFFMSYMQGQEENDVSQIQARVEDELESRDDAEMWRQRIHYVTDSAWSAGSVGQALADRGSWSIGIDRTQRFREVGYLATPDNFGNWNASLRSVTFEARYYNHEFEKQQIVDALQSTPITTFAGERIGSGYVDFSLPSAEEMSTYDTMHLDLTLGCGDPLTEDCGEWDYLVHAYVCAQPHEESPFGEQACQPHVPQVSGICYADGVATETTCAMMEDCVPEEKTNTDTNTETDTDTSTKTDPPETVWTCEGFEAEIPADTQPCTCTEPTGVVTDNLYTCNAEGTGYGDCACGCSTELGRWITAYARGGRWVSDASPLLALLKDGGDKTVRFASSYGYDNTLTLHLSNSGKDIGSPTQIHPLFGGGSFNQDYNNKYDPIEIEIPADATRVELVAVISGHGWGADVENCAEFCNHTHHFTVDGTEYVKDHPVAGASEGCIEQIEVGTVPNQFGTWPYGRGGWCPGKQVDPWIVDVTDSLTPGSTTTVTYQGLFNGADYVPVSSGSGQGFGARIDMVSHMVIYQ